MGSSRPRIEFMTPDYVHQYFDGLSNTVQEEQRIYDVARHIHDHLDRSVSLDELAEISSYSSRHLQFVFWKRTGKKIGRYIQELKLCKALRLLKAGAGSQSMIEVALSVGYDSPSSFSRAFKRRFFCTPSDVHQHTVIHDPVVNMPLASTPSLEKVSYDRWQAIGRVSLGFDGLTYKAIKSIREELLIELVRSGRDVDAVQWFFTQWQDIRQTDWEQCQFFFGFLLDAKEDNYKLRLEFPHLDYYQALGGDYFIVDHQNSQMSLWESFSKGLHYANYTGRYRVSPSCVIFQKEGSRWCTQVLIPINESPS